MCIISYNEFRIKFTNYIIIRKIAGGRWFEDVCEKVSLDLKRNFRIEKYKINRDYITLDEFLAIANKESRNIIAKETLARKLVVAFKSFKDRTIRILKKDN